VILSAVDEILGLPAPADPELPSTEFDRDHLRLLTDALTRKAADLEQSKTQLQVLSRRLMEAQETERRQISRELHDEVGQNLTLLKINLHRVGKQAGVDSSLKESIALVEHTLQQIRNLSLDLRPALLDTAGLNAALRWFLDRQAERTGLTIRYHSNPTDTPLPADLGIVCYRIVQEALTNIIRHARAHRVDVELSQNGVSAILIVRDDGVGFDVRTAQMGAQRGKSLGLLGMQERAQLAGGEVEITSTPSRGTSVRAHFPLPRAGETREVGSGEWGVVKEGACPPASNESISGGDP
jgi:signal transduction histidine kinase